jgi:hypothetical protein
MPQTADCPACRQPLNVPDALLGHAVKCPRCAKTFTAPGGEDDAPPRRPPPVLAYADDDPPPPRHGSATPGKVQAVAAMTLGGGIVMVLISLAYMATCVLLVWPGTYFSLVAGIVTIVKGSALLGERANREPPPQTTAILQIINIVNGDIINLTLGILTLVFLGDPEVKRYFRG